MSFERNSIMLRAALLAIVLNLLMPSPAFGLDLQGHRGARGLLPENTLPAFQRALELGVTTLELDCGVTKDGVVVISHDPLLNPDLTRDAQGRWLDRPGPAIFDLELADLQRYDVGRLKPDTAYAKRFPRQQPVDGTRIPRLADVFALVESAGSHDVRFNIETKLSPLKPDDTAAPDVFVRALLATISAAGMERRVTIQSFDWRTLQIVQKEAPSIPTVYLTAARTSPRNIEPAPNSSPWTAGFDPGGFGESIPRAVKAAGGAVWSPYYAELTREALDEAQALGLKVVPWTVNTEAYIRRLIEWGVDGIISDYPDLLLAVARARAR